VTLEESWAERQRHRVRFERLALEFWKEYCDAVKPIEERYGMTRTVGGYDVADDVEGLKPQWLDCFFRSVYSIDEEIYNKEHARES